MPRGESSNTTHIAVTDHRVLRKPSAPPKTPAGPASELPLVHFHRDLLGPDDEARTRDLGIALVDLATLDDGKVRDFLCQKAQPLLDQAVAHAPDDVQALEARGYALHVNGKPQEALRVLAAALAIAPDRETVLFRATLVADASGQVELAAEYGRRLVELYPKSGDYQQRLAVIYMRKQDWQRAQAAAEAAVRLDPFSSDARAVLISALLPTRDFVRARKEFETLGAINPQHQERIRAWFEERQRR